MIFECFEALSDYLREINERVAERLEYAMHFLMIFCEVIILDHASNNQNIFFRLHAFQDFDDTALVIRLHIFVPAQLFHHDSNCVFPLDNDFCIWLFLALLGPLLSQRILHFHLADVLDELAAEGDEFVSNGLHGLEGFVVLIVDIIIEVAEHNQLAELSFVVLLVGQAIFGEFDQRSQAEDGQVISLRLYKLLIAQPLHSLLRLQLANLTVKCHHTNAEYLLHPQPIQIHVLDKLPHFLEVSNSKKQVADVLKKVLPLVQACFLLNDLKERVEVVGGSAASALKGIDEYAISDGSDGYEAGGFLILTDDEGMQHLIGVFPGEVIVQESDGALNIVFERLIISVFAGQLVLLD